MKWKGFQTKLDGLGLSQTRFATLAGYPRERISKWKHNRRGLPKWVPSWLRLFEALPAEKQRELRAS